MSTEAKNQKTQISPWLIILLTAPVPLILFALFFYKWYHERTDFSQITTRFVQRQNQVMAFDAISVSRRFAHLMNRAATDVKTLSLVDPTAANLKAFHGGHRGMAMELDNDKKVTRQIPLPLYRSLSVMNTKGDELISLVDGVIQPRKRKLAQCLEIELCDRKTRDLATKLKVGDLRFGNLMRKYLRKGVPDVQGRDVVTVLYRGKSGIFELGLDYRHLKSVVFTPTFPYEAKTDLLHSYYNGNYIYFVDSQNDILLHPKYWHVTGVDFETKSRVKPVLQDGEMGTGRLNISEYQGKKLREYFKRLLSKSFAHRSVDIFRAPNLGGTNRVLSVAPVLVRHGQFEQSGVYGHVVIGCNVDYFEEPTEKFVPYY